MVNKKTFTRKDGYEVFWDNGKLQYLHRYIAEKNVPNPENKCCVNHKDGNKKNNSIDNLEWVTRRENCLHARLNGLSEEKSRGVLDLTWEQHSKIFYLRDLGWTYQQISDEMNLEKRRVWETYNGISYKDFYQKRMEV